MPSVDGTVSTHQIIGRPSPCKGFPDRLSQGEPHADNPVSSPVVFTGECAVTLSAAEAKRAQSWNTVIANVILGSDVPYQDIGHDRHWSGLGGFSVDRRDGAWYCHATGAGGYST